MKKSFFAIISILLLLCVFTSCNNIDYGKSFETQQELTENLEENELHLRYPALFPDQKQEGVKFHYIANRNVEKEKIDGYKIYCFGDKFYTAVYGYDYLSDQIQSEDETRLRQTDSIFVNNMEIKLFEGTAHKESLFLIASVIIDGKQYECRIVGTDATEDGEFTNYIYNGNEQYTQAVQAVTSIFEQLK